MQTLEVKRAIARVPRVICSYLLLVLRREAVCGREGLAMAGHPRALKL